MKIVTVVGARPQFIKAAAISRAISEYNNKNNLKIKEIIVHTGQHYDYNMSDVFFEQLNIPKPDYNLGIGSFSHGKQTAKMLESIEDVLLKEKPDWVLVYGDTNSTLAAALAAVKLHIRIAHVEAGLRSFNRMMPEEINRIITDSVSSLLFCPSDVSVINLKNEGIINNVYNVGDVMYDCIDYYKDKVKLDFLKSLNVNPKQYALATVHREENTNSVEKITNIIEALNYIAKKMPLLLALHPRTKKYISEYQLEVSDQITVLDPVSYLDMIELEINSNIILTDSGGVQKEAYFVKTPCITLREQTEWTETVLNGANHLCGSDKNRIINTFNEIMMSNSIISYNNIYGDGQSANMIIARLVGETNEN